MLFRTAAEGTATEIASANSASIQFWVEERMAIAKGIGLLTKGLRRETGVCWTLRFALLAGLITATSYSIRSAVDARNEYNQETSLSLELEKLNQLNQTHWLENYRNTSLTSKLTCNDALRLSIPSIMPCYSNQTNGALTCTTDSYQELTLDAYQCTVNITATNNQSVSLNTLCLTRTWDFSAVTHNHLKLNALFSDKCCPILYSICNDILNFPSLPTYSQSKSIGPGIGAALSLVTILLELLNTYLTEARRSLSRPRCLFFPLRFKLCVLSQAEEKELRSIAAQHNIIIDNQNLQATLTNFQAALDKRIVPTNPDNIPLASPAL